MKNAIYPIVLLLFVVLALLGPGRQTLADNLHDAQRLLRITSVGEQFELKARNQTADIIKTYSSIVIMSTDVTLPDSIKQQIVSCYEAVYSWEKFEAGIARIFADNLNRTELTLLIDFFSDRSIPPTRIDQFKNLHAKAPIIEQMSTQYMLDNSQGCDEHNVALILAYLTEQGGK